MLYLIDTGVLLRAVDRYSQEHPAIMSALRELHRRRDRLSVSAQSIREFWNVSTRPSTARGGYGRSVERTVRWVTSFERILQILPETLAANCGATRGHWSSRPRREPGRGCGGLRSGAILTLNDNDFSRLSTLPVITPRQIVAPGP